MIQSERSIFMLLDAGFWIVRADLQVLLVKLAWLCWGRRGDMPEVYPSVKTAPTLSLRLVYLDAIFAGRILSYTLAQR